MGFVSGYSFILNYCDRFMIVLTQSLFFLKKTLFPWLMGVVIMGVY